MPGFEQSTSVTRNRHSNHYANMLSDDVDNLKDNEERKLNIIVVSVEESASNHKDKRNEDDTKVFIETCQNEVKANISSIDISKITQRNSCRFIFHESSRDTDTSLLINRLNLDSLYARRLIQQATMFYKIHYNLVDRFPPSYIQHANHISSRTDHPLKYCNKNPLQINAYKYSFFPRSMNIWNRLPCSAVSHVIPSVDNFHKFAIPAIRDMQPLYGAALI